MLGERQRSARGLRWALLAALPATVISLSVIVWITAVSRSGFWADDFLNMTQYARTLGDLSNDHVNTGKYIANVFWAVGTIAFGSGSVVPFLLLNSLVFAAGVVVWLRVGARTAWSPVEAWWIGGLFIATAAWYPTALWSSNIVHSAGFLALGLALFAHERCIRADSVRGCAWWSVATGAAWTLGVISDLVYVGLLVIACYCAWHQIARLRQLGVTPTKAVAGVSFWSVVLPLVYFFAVAYPATKSNAAYSTTGLRFVHANLRYYRSLLAPTTALTIAYFALLIGALVGGGLAARRRADYLPLALLGASGATALPALVQSQQRDIHYVAMPLLLAFSAAAAVLFPVLRNWSTPIRSAVLAVAVVTLALIFRQGADIRAYFVSTPYGNSLAMFRSQVAELTPPATIVCAQLNLDASHQALLEAEMSGANGFVVPPINAARAVFVTGAQRCPVGPLISPITIGLNPHGDFVASAP